MYSLPVASGHHPGHGSKACGPRPGRKLGAANRTEGVARARELSLIPYGPPVPPAAADSSTRCRVETGRRSRQGPAQLRVSQPGRARRCASDAVDAALADLHGIHARLVAEIRASDDASAARIEVLLGMRWSPTS